MRCFSIAVQLLIAAPVAAACFVCDEVVEVTAETAACYTENFDALMEALEVAPAGRQIVNMAACEDEGAAARRNGLIEMGALPAQGSRAIKSVYILNAASAICLRDLIAAHEGPFDPAVAFDLVELCDGR